MPWLESENKEEERMRGSTLSTFICTVVPFIKVCSKSRLPPLPSECSDLNTLISQGIGCKHKPYTGHSMTQRTGRDTLSSPPAKVVL